MKIIQLYAENIKRLKAVEITPTDNTIIISGKNENGKSSVIDSIWLALEYREAVKENKVPLRIGEQKGIVTLDLGDYIVTRKFTENDSTLEIRTPDGSKITSPQKLLDGMIGDLSFDPWAFCKKTEEEQRQILADVLFKITGGKLDLASYDQKYKEAFDTRTEINREKKRLAALLTTIKPPSKDDPTEEKSSESLTAAITEAVEAKTLNSSLTTKYFSLEKEVQAYEEKLRALVAEFADVRAKLASVQANNKSQDVTVLNEELRNLESNNKRAREVKEYTKITDGLRLLDEEVTKLNNTMELLEIEKAEALESSPLPVKGLRISAEGVGVMSENGEFVPFAQGSSAQKLKISMGIAVAANPKLRVIRISDGSLLDDSSMQILKDIANSEDFQIWVEFTSRNENDRVGVYIEDGLVK